MAVMPMPNCRGSEPSLANMDCITEEIFGDTSKGTNADNSRVKLCFVS